MGRVRTFKPRPIHVEAVQNDGTIDNGEFLIRWVKTLNPNQELYYEEMTTGRLVLHGPNGTFDLFEGWWLVRNLSGKFEVLDDEQFKNNYEEI